ncbi:MAG TPA: glutathione S-transferase family protein [Kofleriaceae bacterium]
MKLYYHPLSGNSRRALLVTAHLGVSLERVLVDLPKGEQKGAPHRARNPNGHVPVLEDGDFLLWESRAIMQYLCDKTPGQTLYPTDLIGRADVNRWLFWCASHMTIANTVFVYENFVKPLTGRRTDPSELARGEALHATYAPVLDAHLAGKTWVSQDRVTIADYSLAASFALAEPARIPLAPYAHLRAWLGRVQQLEAWQATQPQPRA